MRALLLITALVSFLLDRLTKLWAVKTLSTGTITVIPGLFELRYAENRGAAFSLFSSAPEPLRKLFLLLIPLLITLFVLYYGLFKVKDRLGALALGLILGGALGNIYDRLFYGRVVDFLDFYFKSYHYPTFNLADVSVFLGVLLLIYRSLRES